MHYESLERWQHEHTFGQEAVRAGERRTWLVTSLTAVMMVVEILAGLAFGSMALLADGLHMASHTVALGIAAGAYIYARRHATDARFTFGTGKVNSLAGFTGALLLALFALIMAWESIERLMTPLTIAFDEAILVAVVGLGVNGFCAVMLNVEHEHPHGHHDHNLRSAYLHVLADALTSVLAIVALLSGRFFGLSWMDPVMGLVGAGLVAHWSRGLLRECSHVLLDHQAPEFATHAVREALEARGVGRVVDLHVWSIGPGRYAAVVGVVTDKPETADFYKGLLPEDIGLVHASIEVHYCAARPG